MRRVIFTSRADAEFMRAIHHYNAKSPGLGDRFRDSIFKIFDRIAQQPEAFPRILPEIRRAVIRVFPFVVHFLTEEHKIVILSVFHTSRDPGTLKSRGIKL